MKWLKMRVSLPAMFAGVLIGHMLMGCSWFSNGGSAVAATGAGQAAACVMSQITSGVSDPTAIVGACIGVTLDDVVSIAESLLSYYLSGDAGAPMTASRQAQFQSLVTKGNAPKAHK